jgi:hypothetical protein
MRRRRRQAGLTLFGVAGLLLGCEHAHSARNPPDPLLLSKRPIASRPLPGIAPVVARHEPPAPAGLVLVASANTEADTPNAARQPSGPAIPTSLQRDDLNEE